MRPLALTTIRALINARRAQINTIWKNLSSILNNKDSASLFRYILTFLQQEEFTTKLVSSYSTIIYSESPHKTPLTLLCYLHYDPEAPASPQAQAIAASLLSLSTYQTLLATRTDIPPITLKWVLGQKSLAHVFHQQSSIEEQVMPFHTDACLWYEPVMTERTLQGSAGNLVLATGTKGYLCVELQVQTAHGPLHSSYGTIAPNAAWRLLWALNSLKDHREEILIEGFYDTIVPLEDDALQQLADLPDTAGAQAARWDIPDLLMGLQGVQMHYAHILTPTCTINRLTSGEDATTFADYSIPATARAIVDFHLVPGQDPTDIFAKLKRHLHTRGFADIHVTQRYAGSPAYTPAQHSFIQQVAQSAERVYDQAPLILPVLPEHVPIRTFLPNPAQPAVILPLYAPESQQPAEHEEVALCNSLTHLISIMVDYPRSIR